MFMVYTNFCYLRYEVISTTLYGQVILKIFFSLNLYELSNILKTKCKKTIQQIVKIFLSAILMEVIVVDHVSRKLFVLIVLVVMEAQAWILRYVKLNLILICTSYAVEISAHIRCLEFIQKYISLFLSALLMEVIVVDHVSRKHFVLLVLVLMEVLGMDFTLCGS